MKRNEEPRVPLASSWLAVAQLEILNLPRGHTVNDQLARFAADQNLVLNLTFVRTQIAALNCEQSAAFQWARSGMNLRVCVCVC